MKTKAISARTYLSIVTLLGAPVSVLLNASPATASGAERPATFCNPMDLAYSFQTNLSNWRTAADPAVIVYKGEYWLFATNGKGYWRSKDCLHWTFVTQTSLPIDNDAPALLTIGGKLYWTAINTGFMRRMIRARESGSLSTTAP